jgi:hypothetical protein
VCKIILKQVFVNTSRNKFEAMTSNSILVITGKVQIVVSATRSITVNNFKQFDQVSSKLTYTSDIDFKMCFEPELDVR